MQTIRVHTTQNVFIHYPLASIGDRILAYILDLLLLIIYIVIVFAIFIKLDVEIWWPWAIAAMPMLFYSLVWEITMNGQSPGKYLMKIKVVRLDGTPPTVGDYILRWIFRLIDFNLMSGIVAMLAILIGGKGQRVGDVVAGTTVVKLVEQSQISAQDLFVVTDSGYEPVFAEAVNLSSKDIELIQQALEVNKRSGNNKPVLVICEKIKLMLGIQTDLPPVKFLYTIVKDFNHYTSIKA